MTNKNPMKVITGPDTLWSYVNAWEPKSINGSTPKFSIQLRILKTDKETLSKIDKAIQAAYEEGAAKLKGNSRSIPPLDTLKTPLRDGDKCFYCNDPFSDEKPRTREHLVAATAGGPNHISNLFHACGPCNHTAGHLSAPEKIRLRDQMRGVA